jgi:hypothetical protein
VLIAAGLLAIVIVRFHSPWSERHPQVSQVAYVTDQKQAWRAGLTPGLDPWTRRVLTADGGAIATRGFPPLVGRKANAAPARLLPVAGPLVSAAGKPGEVFTLSLVPPLGARIIGLDLKSSVPVTDVRVDGRASKLLGKAGVTSHLRWAAEPQGVTVTFRLPPGHGALDIDYGVMTDAWPAGAKPLPPRPKTLAPWDQGDSTVVFGKFKQTW